MKAESKNLKLTGTNSYLVWVSNYYRERSNGKEVRIILFGNVFHVYFVEYDKENKSFSIELQHHFSKEYGKEVEPVNGLKQILIQEYEYGKRVVHQLRGGYCENEFDFSESKLDAVIETALQTI